MCLSQKFTQFNTLLLKYKMSLIVENIEYPSDGEKKDDASIPHIYQLFQAYTFFESHYKGTSTNYTFMKNALFKSIESYINEMPDSMSTSYPIDFFLPSKEILQLIPKEKRKGWFTSKQLKKLWEKGLL